MLEPIHPAHQQRNRLLDAFGEVAEKDGDGEYVSAEVEAAYSAAAYGPNSGSAMTLERQEAMGFVDGEMVIVDAWYFHCSTCGLLLPGQRRPRLHPGGERP